MGIAHHMHLRAKLQAPAHASRENPRRIARFAKPNGFQEPRLRRPLLGSRIDVQGLEGPIILPRPEKPF